MSKIISAKILHRELKSSVVMVILDTGESKILFDYFPDEISFIEEEFIGKTSDEALDMFVKKDTEYLRS